MDKKSKRGKKGVGRRTISGSVSKDIRQTGIEKSLIENFVSIQRVLVNLSVKIDNLTGQISKLLELFEISAKALAEKNFQTGDNRNNTKIAEKIDTLLDQNKTIARGLTLMHELNSRQEMPNAGYSSQQPVVETGVMGYQKSIASSENTESESPLPFEAKKFKKLP